MSFFPSYKDNWTRTPNVYFDVVVKKGTANQIRLVSYLIRQTIGYNREAKWVAVTRRELIEEAEISNGCVSDTIKSCKENGWVLVYEQGEKTKKERYIFLNDPINQLIVKGLENKCFEVADLEYLNLAGITKLLSDHGLLEEEEENGCSSTEIGENGCSSTKTVQVAYTKTVQGTSTETVQANKVPSQAAQGVSTPLKTIIKDNLKNNQTNKEDCLIDFPSKEVEQKTMAFIQYAFQNGMHVQSVQATKKRYAEALAKGIAHEDLMKALEDSFKLFGANTVPISVITTVIANHEVAEQAKKAAAEEEEKKKKALKENENFLVRNLRAAGLSDREIEIALKGGK